KGRLALAPEKGVVGRSSKSLCIDARVYGKLKLKPDTTYEVKVDRVEDEVGNKLAEPFTFRFKTVSESPVSFKDLAAQNLPGRQDLKSRYENRLIHWEGSVDQDPDSDQGSIVLTDQSD